MQDATTICAPVAGQLLALASLKHGTQYVRDMVASLTPNRALLQDALSVLGPDCPVYGGAGALYLWARLPAACGLDDVQAVEWLVKHAGICVVPGSAFGMPGKHAQSVTFMMFIGMFVLPVISKVVFVTYDTRDGDGTAVVAGGIGVVALHACHVSAIACLQQRHLPAFKQPVQAHCAILCT